MRRTAPAENGYRDAHRADLDKHIAAIESDGGVFKPLGFGFTGSDSAFALVRQIGLLLAGIGSGDIARGGGGADIGPMALGVRASGSTSTAPGISGITTPTPTPWTSWTSMT
jgi:hypothetical protein